MKSCPSLTRAMAGGLPSRVPSIHASGRHNIIIIIMSSPSASVHQQLEVQKRADVEAQHLNFAPCTS